MKEYNNERSQLIITVGIPLPGLAGVRRSGLVSCTIQQFNDRLGEAGNDVILRSHSRGHVDTLFEHQRRSSRMRMMRVFLIRNI